MDLGSLCTSALEKITKRPSLTPKNIESEHTFTCIYTHVSQFHTTSAKTAIFRLAVLLLLLLIHPHAQKNVRNQRKPQTQRTHISALISSLTGTKQHTHTHTHRSIRFSSAQKKRLNQVGEGEKEKRRCNSTHSKRGGSAHSWKQPFPLLPQKKTPFDSNKCYSHGIDQLVRILGSKAPCTTHHAHTAAHRASESSESSDETNERKNEEEKENNAQGVSLLYVFQLNRFFLG